MNSSISRRGWFKSVGGLTAGFVGASSLANTLMAAPVSRAEEEFFSLERLNGKKIRLNSNENPYGPSEKAKAAVIQSLSESNRYPFDEMEDLKKLIANKVGIDPAYILLGAGSGEMLCRAGIAYGLKGGRVLSAYPTFPLLMNYAEYMNATWDRVDLDEKMDHNYSALLSAIKKDTQLVFISNPNNPTGTAVSTDIVHSFCEAASKTTTIYVDEAYLEFLEPDKQKSMIPMVKNNPNIIVSRTFSKVYGLAGLRVGYIVAHPDVVKRISQFGDEVSPSQAGLAAATAALNDEAFMKLTREKNAIARKILTDYLDNKKIFYGKSLTNVVFFPAPKDGKTILQKLEEKGFLIRVWDYQQKEWCRVSIGTLNEMKALVKAFDEVIS